MLHALQNKPRLANSTVKNKSATAVGMPGVAQLASRAITAPVQHETFLQLKDIEKEPLQRKAPFQFKDIAEDEPLQMKGSEEEKLLQKKPFQLTKAKPAAPVGNTHSNQTGLPDNLKGGIENLSGIAMDDVKVHYNSAQPAQLNALAYAQGINIHIAPGQEKHLPHEAWHVVQQKQGRVKPTMQMKGGAAVNDDKGLEHEADVMGARAVSEANFANGFLPGKQKQISHVATGNSISQLIVLNLDTADHGITADAAIAKRRQERDLKRQVDNIDDTWSPQKKELLEPLKLIAEENPGEPLTILAHGLPAIGDNEPEVAGKTALQLFNELVSFGLTPRFKGVIDLSNCTTAWSRDGEHSFAEKFYNILKSKGYSNTVTGFRSFVSSPDISTEKEIDYTQRERALVEFIITRYINEVDVFTNDSSTPGEKKAAAGKLAVGNTLVFQELRQMLTGRHDDTFEKIWYGLWKILERIVKRGDKITQGQALDFQVELMELKRNAGAGDGAIKTVAAEKVVFKEPDRAMLMMTLENIKSSLE